MTFERTKNLPCSEEWVETIKISKKRFHISLLDPRENLAAVLTRKCHIDRERNVSGENPLGGGGIWIARDVSKTNYDDNSDRCVGKIYCVYPRMLLGHYLYVTGVRTYLHTPFRDVSIGTGTVNKLHVPAIGRTCYYKIITIMTTAAAVCPYINYAADRRSSWPTGNDRRRSAAFFGRSIRDATRAVRRGRRATLSNVILNGHRRIGGH